ncbi:MAG: DinB family protein [Bacteroidia bacterium]|nr:DinB family protein [Bacteroidia bacterium]NNF30532.1 DinB family protein [Flavobacteriaceae bacterium]MBT8277134.1 DinB family protein [Bacteroidia bacterium]NNJ81046.1 DinB family protein [Flavobacteriaceae bacterium]NNK53879.1 DinB family protein [Flavobacteriaceae bacterium]
MKRLILPFVCMLLLSFSESESGLTKEEREMAISEMTNSHDHLMIALHGLSEAQLNYKMTPESWSIAECVEHIAISEDTFSGMLLGLLKTKADPANRDKVSVEDKDLIAMMVDRSNKVKTQKPFEPTGKYGSHEATVKAFKAARLKNIDFVNSSDADFRNRVQEFPFGTVDAYQVVLFMSAHSERHIRQIEEIKYSTDFPKK